MSGKRLPASLGAMSEPQVDLRLFLRDPARPQPVDQDARAVAAAGAVVDPPA
jgi:methylglyoxal synthase